MFTNLLQKYQNQILKERLYRGGLELESEMRKIVARDTGRLEESIKTDPVIQRSSTLMSCDVGSEGVSYAVYVDQGVKGKTYNYHKGSRKDKNRPVIYRGVGQKFIQRALIGENGTGGVMQKILLILKGQQ